MQPSVAVSKPRQVGIWQHHFSSQQVSCAFHSCVNACSQTHTTPIIVFLPDLPSKQVMQRHWDPASASIRALVLPECQINSMPWTTDHFSLQQTKNNSTNCDSRCSELAFPMDRAVGQALKNHLENRSSILHFATALLQTAESYRLTLLQPPQLRSWDNNWPLR